MLSLYRVCIVLFYYNIIISEKVVNTILFYPLVPYYRSIRRQSIRRYQTFSHTPPIDMGPDNIDEDII